MDVVWRQADLLAFKNLRERCFDAPGKMLRVKQAGFQLVVLQFFLKGFDFFRLGPEFNRNGFILRLCAGNQFGHLHAVK